PQGRIGGLPESTVEARTIERLVSAAASEGVYSANCLERSLTLWWLLRRQGFASQLKIGVRKKNDRLEAHAWIELDGTVLNDDPAVRSNYSPFTQDIASLHAEIQ
ncbi:MAG: lasso peptide biosynthesis B2 protein, partial [Candidatus Acidiferrales bacterium]